MNENKRILTRIKYCNTYISPSMVPWKLIPYYWWACPWFIYRSSARNYSLLKKYYNTLLFFLDLD